MTAEEIEQKRKDKEAKEARKKEKRERNIELRRKAEERKKEKLKGARFHVFPTHFPRSVIFSRETNMKIHSVAKTEKPL